MQLRVIGSPYRAFSPQIAILARWPLLLAVCLTSCCGGNTDNDDKGSISSSNSNSNMSWLVGTSRHFGTDRDGHCDEYGHHARDDLDCFKNPDVDWEWLCPCDTSRQEMDIQCGIPTRGLDLSKMGFSRDAVPSIRAFAEANRGGAECRERFVEWRKTHYPDTKSIY